MDAQAGGLSTEDGCEHVSLPILDFAVKIENTTAMTASEQRIILTRMAWTEHPAGQCADEGWSGYRFGASDGPGELVAIISRTALRRLALKLLSIVAADETAGR